MEEAREVTDINQWDNFVEASTQGTIFSKSDWLNLHDKKYKLWGYFVGDVLKGGIVSINGKLPITPFQGVLVDPSASGDSVATALVDYVPDEFDNHYTLQDIRPFLWAGFKSIVRYTYVVDLTTLDEKNLEKQTRYDINRARRDGIEVSPSRDIQFFDSLYEYTFSRKGIKRTASEELVAKVAGIGEIMVASDNTSATLTVRDGKRAYYILGASTGSGSSSLVLWETFRHLVSQGVKEIDLVGCNDYKIAQFKKGFGGTLKPYYGVSRA